jgi:hypothetical protein
MKTSELSRYALRSCAAAMMLAGCGGSQSPISTPGAMPQSRTPRFDANPASSKSCPAAACIFVIDHYGDRRVTVYPANATGNVSPYRKIAGKKTQLLNPIGIAVDSRGQTYVSSSQPALFVYSATANGDATPLRSIMGRATRLRHFWIANLAVDTNQYVYVTDNLQRCHGVLGCDYNGYVTVYAPGSHGNVTPTRMIYGRKTGMFNRRGPAIGIAVDSAGYTYVTTGKTGVLVYAPEADGNVAPSWGINGSKTRLSTPYGVAVDNAGNVYVADLTGSLHVYAAGQHGNVAPIQDISGSKTRLIEPTSVAVDASHNIYVTNENLHTRSYVTVYAAGATGNVAPIQIIKGSKTRLAVPYEIAVH